MAKREAKAANGGMFDETVRQWDQMSVYQRFEQVIAVLLSIIIAVVVVIAVAQLALRVWQLLVVGALDPLDHEVFQAIFGMIMTVMIAMEFKHSIIRVAARHQSVIQAKTLVLIALMAVSRKFIILDTESSDAMTIGALAAGTIVLGSVYWLLRERDDRAGISPHVDATSV
jgi:uncharacterized membrane protein (DUF373 family)